MKDKEKDIVSFWTNEPRTWVSAEQRQLLQQAQQMTPVVVQVQVVLDAEADGVDPEEQVTVAGPKRKLRAIVLNFRVCS